MKNFTATEIAALINKAIGLDDDGGNLATKLRGWGRKWFEGQIVKADAYNDENIRKQLVADYGQDVVEQALQCSIEDITVVRNTKVTSSVVRLDPEDMQEGTVYLLISHVNRHTLKFMGKTMIDDDMVYLFTNEKQFKTAQDTFRALTYTELTSERWQIREIAE